MAKKIDPKAKSKRQKIMLAVGGVILLGLLVFQVPRTMKMLNQHGADDSAAATATAGSPSTAPVPSGSSPTGAAAAPASAAAGGDGLTDPDSVPTPQSGQLLAFSRFRTKDPFAQQLDLTCGSASSSGGESSTASSCGSGSGSGSTPASDSSAPKKAKSEAAQSPKGRTITLVSPGGSTSTATKPTTAKISVNGNSESVQVGADFPASSPTFTLVSLTKSSAKIGIAGGSLESGSPTITLTLNKPLTLMNTADGTRYVLRLISVS
jgi:hypothetical protein